MKNILLVYVVLCGATHSRAQTPEPDVRTEAQIFPYFKGCAHLPDGSAEKRTCSDAALTAFITRRLQSGGPSDKEGVAYVSFIIDEQGKVKNPAIVRGVGGAQDTAALDAVGSFPDWEPARDGGRPVKIRLSLPIKFTVKSDPQFNPAYDISWGPLKGSAVQKSEALKCLDFTVSVRDETGAQTEITELNFERARNAKTVEARSAGALSEDMKKIIRKLKPGDILTITATVQRGGKFSYSQKSFTVRQ